MPLSMQMLFTRTFPARLTATASCIRTVSLSVWFDLRPAMFRNMLAGQVVDSRIWLHRLKQKIVEAKDRGEAVWITVK